MRVSLSWLADQVELPDGSTAAEVAEAFVRVGLEVEDIHEPPALTGPLVVGEVLSFEMVEKVKKPIRYCQVDVGSGTGSVEPVGIICGAENFAAGDLVVVARPGAVLPGDFEISARKTYGHISEGMICSVRELGIGTEHAGILVLGAAAESAVTPGTDARALLGLNDPVIELAVTPDRGYCFSVRGLARELGCALDVHFRDPAAVPLPEEPEPAWPVRIDDGDGCRRFVARRVTGVDPAAPTPWWMRRRLLAAGVRPISLAVDVTNYVMFELGQPLHAYDTGTLTGDIVVRRATAGEKLTTLDDAVRALDPDDLLITDGSGPIGLAGVMGGAATEISAKTDDVLLEAANFEPAVIARAARRHKLPSEASRRFERAVDPALCAAAAERAAALLVQYGGGMIAPGRTDVGSVPAPAPIALPLELPDRIAGVRYERGATARRLGQIGCQVQTRAVAHGHPELVTTPPTWRPDLRVPIDLVEEVLRLEGLDKIPSTLPPAPAGRGLTAAQRRRRSVSRALAEAGYTEVLPFPFVSPAVFDALGTDPDDVRRHTLTLQNPIDADRPALATTLLPGLLDAVIRNVARGLGDVALYHVGQVVLPRTERVPVPSVGVAGPPSRNELAQLATALPEQPVHVAVALAGAWERPGWWGPGRPASWADAVEAAHAVARAAGVSLEVQAAELPPWHPGRCARLSIGGFPVGHAGELHPKVIEALGLPPRTCAMELDLDLIPLTERRPAPVVSPFPPVLLDLALVVADEHAAAQVEAALAEGAGPLLEDLRLFDVYTGEQVGEGKRSLAFSLRFRAPDRTLTLEEATAARDAAAALAADRVGATVRT